MVITHFPCTMPLAATCLNTYLGHSWALSTPYPSPQPHDEPHVTVNQTEVSQPACCARPEEWFHSDSDEDLPAACRAALLGSSAAQCLREQVMRPGLNQKTAGCA